MNSKMVLPALSQNAFLRYFNFIVLYFVEGLPQGMLFIGIPAWLAVQGKSVTEIGAFAVACSLPWTFKFVVAPLMDRYTYLPMGRKRPWVLLSHLGLIISLIWIAFVPDPLNNLQSLYIAAFILSSCGAIQDAAGDAMAVDVIPDEQQARANGYMQGSRMLGSSLALVTGTWMINNYSFKLAMLTICLFVCILTLVPLLLREREGEKILPFLKGKASQVSQKMQMSRWSSILKALYEVFRLKNSILVIFLLFITQGAYAYFEHLLPIFTIQNTGWTNSDYSQIFATADIVGGIGGILLGGFLIERFGKKRMIHLYFLIIIALALLLVFVKAVSTNTVFMDGFIITYRIFNAFAKIGVFAIAMQCCSRNVSASQFTLYMSFGATGSIAGSALLGPIKNNFSWDFSFLFFVGFMALAWLILSVLNIDKQVATINALEKKQIENELKEAS